MKTMCLICEGTGKVKKHSCSHCLGRGYIIIKAFNKAAQKNG